MKIMITLLALIFTTVIDAARPASTAYVDESLAEFELTVKSAVGQVKMGGVVFWVDAGGTHGLIAASNDIVSQNTMRWGGPINLLVQADTDGTGAGKTNTLVAYMTQSINSDTAASAVQACATYSVDAGGLNPCGHNQANTVDCYGDWYLPSKFELNLLYLNKTALSAPPANRIAPTGPHWSSTEFGIIGPNGAAYYQDMDTGQQGGWAKPGLLHVRCIRSF